jgi:hypothetical protein
VEHLHRHDPAEASVAGLFREVHRPDPTAGELLADHVLPHASRDTHAERS